MYNQILSKFQKCKNCREILIPFCYHVSPYNKVSNSSFSNLLAFTMENNKYCIFIYIHIISRRSITPQHIKYNSNSLDEVQSLYFGSKLPSSGTYK